MKTVNLHQHTILIVNGNDHDRIALSDSLNDAGFGTVEAKNPKLAVIYFRQIQPDLVLMDLDMPDVQGGLKLCGVLTAAARTSNTPIIVLSKHNDMELAATAFDAGASDFVLHPINNLILIQRCRYQIRSSQNLMSLKAGT